MATKSIDSTTFNEIQENVSNSLSELLNWCNEHSIPTYFAALPRSHRPLYIRLHNGDVSPYQYHENVDINLTEDILNTLVYPSFQIKNISLKKALQQHTRHHATYLADVITVACSMLIDDSDHKMCWDSYSLCNHATIKHNGVFSRSVFGNNVVNVPYIHANFCVNANKHFYSLRTTPEVLRKLKKKLFTVTNNRLNYSPLGRCTIWTDTLLNDVDDIPANLLAGILSDSYITIMNYNY